jgi:glycosyltransferase involved in cell wall biosynthesis
MWHHGLNKESARLSLVVPAFDEARTIETVLDRVFDSIPDVHEVIVIDDASSDNTSEVCRAYIGKEQRVKLLRHETNQGKTAALRTGFAACTGTIVVVQDADLEYDPREIPDLIAPIKEGAADVCLGSRFLVHRPGRVLYFRLDAIWYLIKFNVLTGLEQSFRQEFLEAKPPVKSLAKRDRSKDVVNIE